MTYKSKGKQPYIPLYIGDWEQDTNCISLEAEGALLKLIFKLWKSDEKGSAIFQNPQLSILLKKSEEMTLKILQELQENKVLNIEFLNQNSTKIQSRRMLKEIELSKVRKEVGKKGGKQKSSKALAKGKQIAEYDNEYNTLNNKKDVDKIYTPTEKCTEILNSTQWIENIAMTQKQTTIFVKDKLVYFLNKESLKEEFKEKSINDIKDHFVNWLLKILQNTPMQPKTFKPKQ